MFGASYHSIILLIIRLILLFSGFRHGADPSPKLLQRMGFQATTGGLEPDHVAQTMIESSARAPLVWRQLSSFWSYL